MAVETNVSSAFNSTGALVFRTGEPGNGTGGVILGLDGTNNGITIQFAQQAAAGANAANFSSNFSFAVKDKTGTTYYIPAVAATW